MLTGARGQLGTELTHTAPSSVALAALDHAALDLTDASAVDACMSALRPAVIINAAAYTAVDRAEADATMAHRVNADGAGLLAASAARHGARLIHVSTDYVFSGDAATPWTPTAPTGPASAYGRSKLAGEQAVLGALGAGATILRTSWLYSCHGHNFVKTMLRLMGERDEVRVVADQIGAPTWTRTLSAVIWAAVATPAHSGVFHWSDAGATSWFEFATAVRDDALALGLLTRDVRVVPITTADYPTPARRPAYSVLDCAETVRSFGVPQVPWRAGLRSMLQELAHA